MAKSVSRHYMRAIALWPKDALRPETSFQDAMRRRMETRKELIDRDDAAELQQVNALYSLLDDRYRRKFPVSDAYLHPVSNPDHYQNLVAELEAAPKRSWWAARLNKWKGFLRFS